MNLIMQFSSASRHRLHLRSRYSSQTS